MEGGELIRVRHPPSYYADLYRKHDLTGGHVIKLGPKNDEAARQALQAWTNMLQVGGGITSDNAQEWLDAGASKVRRYPPPSPSHIISQPSISLSSLAVPLSPWKLEETRKLR